MKENEKQEKSFPINTILLYLLIGTIIIMIFWFCFSYTKGTNIEQYVQEQTEQWWEENYSPSYELQMISYSALERKDKETNKEIKCVATIYHNLKNDTCIYTFNVLITMKYKETNLLNQNLIDEKDIISIEIKSLDY